MAADDTGSNISHSRRYTLYTLRLTGDRRCHTLDTRRPLRSREVDIASPWLIVGCHRASCVVEPNNADHFLQMSNGSRTRVCNTIQHTNGTKKGLLLRGCHLHWLPIAYSSTLANASQCWSPCRDALAPCGRDHHFLLRRLVVRKLIPSHATRANSHILLLLYLYVQWSICFSGHQATSEDTNFHHGLAIWCFRVSIISSPRLLCSSVGWLDARVEWSGGRDATCADHLPIFRSSSNKQRHLLIISHDYEDDGDDSDGLCG